MSQKLELVTRAAMRQNKGLTETALVPDTEWTEPNREINGLRN